MNKNIFTCIILLDETKTLVRVKPFYCTSCLNYLYIKKIKRKLFIMTFFIKKTIIIFIYMDLVE